jgi:20S proteasome subunit alpha 6
MAIGARSQSARTYLEKHLNEFLECSVEDLVRHGLRALRDTLPNEVELTSKVICLNFVSNFEKMY